MLEHTGGHMKKLAELIVKYPKYIVGIYVVIAVLSLFALPKVGIEYDLSVYLPEDMTSYQGKNLLEQEFGMGGMASLMVENMEQGQVNELVGAIQKIEGVKEVLYFPGQEKEGAHLIELVFAKGSSSTQTQDAIDAIEALLVDQRYALGGESAIAKDMQDTTNREIILYSIVAFLVIGVILILGSSTYYEPIYFFLAIGIAILLNMGSNIIFGKISSNTNSIASILQLAVSMDYSIFLMHRYHEEKKQYEPSEAMSRAIQKTFTSVSASALTTVGGFLALVGMKYGIGKDMGLVLAKGVLLSLICVMTLLPAVVLLVGERFKGKEHPVRIPSLGRFAGNLLKMRWGVLIVAIVIAIPTFLMHTRVDYYYSNEKTLTEDAKSIQGTERIKETFGMKNQTIVLVPLSKVDQLKETLDAVNQVDGVKSAIGLYSIVSDTLPITLLPKEVIEKFQTDEYTYFALELDRPLEGEATHQTISEVKAILDTKLDGAYYFTGEAIIYDDLQTVTQKDFGVVTGLSILIVGLVLMVTFRSITLPLILLFIIQLGIWVNLSIPYLMGTELNFISFIILGAIQLGATVDYAILFTERYKENLEQQMPYEAAKATIKDTSRAVLTSALILIGGTLSVYLLTTIRSASELTLLIARGSIISIILVFAVLPALLVILHPVIKKTTCKWPKGK